MENTANANAKAKKKVFIIGYMFAGKTTYGQQLACELRLPFVDLDALIEQHCHKSIPEIFHDNGEPFFRLQEHEILERLCDTDVPTVVSCGGGTPCHHDNLSLMKKHGQVIYLKASLEILVARASRQRKNRPLLSEIPDNDLWNFIANQLKEREFFYLQADLIRDSQTITDTQK